MAEYTRCVWNTCVILIGLFSCIIGGTNAKQVVLLDTTKTSGALNWTTKILKPDPPDPSNKGWNEVSTYITQISEDVPIRIYTSCYVSSREVNNWLRTPFIEVQDAKSLHVEMTFTMRKCVQHSDPVTLQQCRETFNLYSYQADKDIANNEMPSWDATTYTRVDKIPAKNLGESASDILLNTETRFVSLNQNLRGIYFAFQDTGSCLALVAIRIYYETCPNTTINYAVFGETATGKDHTSSVQQQGTCVPNSSENTLPLYRCMSDGTWDIPLGGCDCHPGYEGQDDEKCVACQKGYYKWQAGPNICRQCPANSFTDVQGSVECRCLNDYFRAQTDPKDMACTKPPSKPYLLQVMGLTDTTVQLDWQSPQDNGGRTDTTYRIECDSCSSEVMVSPKSKGFNSTSAQLSRLRASTAYSVRVCSENGVSSSSLTEPKCSTVSFKTESSLAQILQIEFTDVGENHVTIAWEVAEEETVQWYEVVHYVKDKSDTEVVNHTRDTSITFNNLLTKTRYEFKVRGNTSQGVGKYSEIISTLTGKPYDTKSEIETGPSVVIIVGAIIAVMLCMLIAGIMIFILMRRNRRNDGKNPDIDGPYHHVTVPLFTPSGTIKSYVDPHTYEDPQQAVREFTREIDASHITIESVIGGGEFGDVCKGKLRIPSRPEMTVAIKTLKSGATDKNRLDFLTEASIMGQFDDPNVIFLEGVVTKSNPIMIVTEYMANGSLDTFLRQNDGQLTVIQLVGMMRGIASGMKYLSEMGYVHRDLAARNILCTESLVCKVADFGLSREVDIDTTDGAYTTKGGKIPVRWTAPEAIAFRKFTSASDVWSLGVVLWEVISYGERPYWNWSNQDVMKAVEKGYRLPPPMECPEAIHQLMLDMWQKERNQRPKFAMIVKTLDKLIRAPELLRKMAKPRPHVFMDNTPADVNHFASVEEWLNVIKMERYRDNFVSAGVTSMDQVMRITVKDLDTLGITLLGHQKKIMNSVQTLRAQLLVPQIHLPHMQVSEGFLV